MKPPAVVLVPAVTDPVGVATHVLHLARLLAAAGMLDVVACPDGGWLADRLGREGLPVAVVPFDPSPAAYLGSSLRLLRFLGGRRSAGIVHLHGRLPLIVAWPAMVACRRLRFVATVHEFAGTRPDGPWGVKGRLETWLLRRLARICCVSGALRDEVVARVGKRRRARVEQIPNWVDPRHPAAPTPRRPGRRGNGAALRLCGIGRLAPEKGFDVLIDAVSILTRHGHDVSCDVYGDGPERARLSARIARHRLGARVALKGPSSEVRAALPEYDLVVIPSKREAFGLVALEAYDAGVPVVASDVPGLDEVVLADRTGLLVPPGDPTALADALARLARSEALGDALARGGRRLLTEQLSSARLTERYLEFYRAASGPA